jgi:hypothetical protein
METNMNEMHKGFKTLEEAKAFKETIVGDYEIVGLYEGSLGNPIFAYFLKEKQNVN